MRVAPKLPEDICLICFVRHRYAQHVPTGRRCFHGMGEAPLKSNRHQQFQAVIITITAVGLFHNGGLWRTLAGAASMAAEAEKEGENKAGVSEGTGVWAVGDGAALARRLVQCAAELGHVEVIRELATLGADVAGCATALHAAAVFGHSSALSALIDLGACVHTADDLGKRFRKGH